MAREGERSAVRAQRAGRDVHHRGLTGAVLSEQAENLARADVESHVVDGDVRAEVFRDRPKSEKRQKFPRGTAKLPSRIVFCTRSTSLIVSGFMVDLSRSFQTSDTM